MNETMLLNKNVVGLFKRLLFEGKTVPSAGYFNIIDVLAARGECLAANTSPVDFGQEAIEFLTFTEVSNVLLMIVFDRERAVTSPGFLRRLSDRQLELTRERDVLSKQIAEVKAKMWEIRDQQDILALLKKPMVTDIKVEKRND